MSTEWRVYVSPDKIMLSNDLGFRIEFDIPKVGNMVVVTLNESTYHIGLFPVNHPRSPSTSTNMTQSDDPSSDGDGGRVAENSNNI